MALDDDPLWNDADPILAGSQNSTALAPSFAPAASNGSASAIVSNGHGAVLGPQNGKVPVFQTGEEADRWMLAHPSEADALLRNYARVAGVPELAERHDLRFGSIPVTLDLDPRRYGIGLGGLTTHMGELRAGEFVVVGAREGNGKTAMAEKIALANCRDFKVLFTTLEQTAEEIRDRLLAKKLGYSLDRLSYERGEGSERYKAALALVSSFDLLIWQPLEKEHHVEALVQRAVDVSADLMVIDHARCIGGWRSGNHGGACDKIVNTLFKATRETAITIVLLAQLNRDAAGRRPTNRHFQDTGFLEQKPDRCILLHRPFAGQEGKDDVCEFIVSKNRKGPMFRAHTWWSGELMNYSSMDEIDEQHVRCCRKKKKDEDE
jgi:hypothetical protein